MKKFNIDEFIWLLILILLTAFIGYLMMSGYIYNFLSPKTAKNLYIALVILPVLIIVQIFKVISFNTRKDNSISYIPIIFTLAIGVFILLNDFVSQEQFSKNDHKFKNSYGNKAIEISYENHHIIEEINESGQEYLGKYIIFTGFVHKHNGEEKFILAREEMNCCVADSVIIGLNSICQDTLNEGQWIKALGKIEYDGEYYFNIEEYIKVKPPENQYF
ncbi:MAG: membrane-spanning protein [Clostridium sp.]|jgi:uncharacterized repeat protein (TIGR03943 family)|uniref:TIGR03943 family putative permease subunit n=1 Tax=Clostridium tertium TaxID=1559 RepID=UPI00241ED283|nr:membrane-spanning protein [Clostridium tertium]MBS6502258.1 membrane-spanning protein [Clostridium sp.]